VVRLWPQLEEILRAYFPAREQMGGGELLFPSFRTGEAAMLTDFRKLLKALVKRAELGKRVTPKMFRHTYCAARLQTLDGGAPVSAFTVGKELGHGGDSMVKRVYGHLGDVRKRGRVVEYRVAVAQPRNARNTLRYTLGQAKVAKLLRRP
jgi:integrase